MKTISLRYTDKFAPENGTIDAHLKILNEKGFVWFGKMGPPISNHIAEDILKEQHPRFLLIHSGTQERYWLYIDLISREQPSYSDFPLYYHNIADEFKTWFRVVRIEKAEKNVMSKCYVVSSGALLSVVSHHSMNPYFIINYKEE